jgi:hypothetical protein
MVRPLKMLFVAFLALPLILSAGPAANASDHDYLGVRARITPFDSRYQRVQHYLEVRELRDPLLPSQGSGKPRSRETVRVLRKYLKTATKFDYVLDAESHARPPCGKGSCSRKEPVLFSDHWQLPEETEDRGAGDCEDKAIWLYARLIREGVNRVRLVVGKYRVNQSAYHAWVAVYMGEKIYILDPTINDGIWTVSQYPEEFYVPIYSFYKEDRWQHRGRRKPFIPRIE